MGTIDLKTYLSRMLKYLIKMLILLGLIFVAMSLTGTSRVSGWDLAREIFVSYRGLILLVALLALALSRPFLGYASIDVRADMDRSREEIINALVSCNYNLCAQDADTMVFRSNSGLRRAISMGEDKLTVTRDRHGITISGLKKDTMRVEVRIRVFTA